ncbi:MAG: methylenetetrahydrofolate dehydrogenase (NADP+) / methenyltetrahydrofolate cyclohydrolase [Parcubacteria group bacterium Gr01-1014_3]|nr:MAG: methylenetetrahydrofolate dehydrogenase (NADP+) / methenyltetrahydrofolate cyclohydrolase [Parcubacteria group bacterium Gr01-1014_3]
MLIIDGKEIARQTTEELKALPNPSKKIAAVFVGDSLASVSFLKQKEKMAKELGILFILYRFSESISEDDLMTAIKEIGGQKTIGGIIVQLPLPKNLNSAKILSAINPAQDIDAMTAQSHVLPLPVGVVESVLRAAKYILRDKVVAVIGRGALVGQPITKWLHGKCKEVLVLHRGSDLNDLRKADLVISGVGKAGLIKIEMLHAGAGVIDFGFDLIGGKIRGDLESDQLLDQPENRLTFYTPTPGGTGPILVAELFRNFYKLNT